MSEEIPQYSDIGPETGFNVRAALLALSAVMLGTALQIRDGLYSPAGIMVLTASLAACVFAVLGPTRALDRSIAPNKLNAFIGLLVSVQLLELLFWRSGASETTVPQVAHNFFNSCVLVAIVGLTLILFGQSRAATKGFVLMLMMFFIMGVWKIRTAPSPQIDVFVFHRDAAEALAHGQNPYSITFPDIYGATGNWVYGQGVVQDGRLQFGYPYPPLTLLMTAVAKLTLGDARYAMLVAMLATGIMLHLIRPDRIGMLVAALLLFTPRRFYVLESAWTEPLSVMVLAALVLSLSPLPGSLGKVQGASAPRRRWYAPICFGLLISTKQYLPATIFLLPLVTGFTKELVRFLIVALLTAALVTLPLALWDFKAFWNSVVALQLRQPFRTDSLSYLAAVGIGPFWVCFAAMATAIILCFRRVGRGVEGFAGSIALCLLVFFAFNKQAFANYYDLVLGAICCAIAAGGSLSSRPLPTDIE